jgi:hypothetical protein
LNIHRESVANFRIFDVIPGPILTLSGLTVSGGRVVNSDGGGIRSFGPVVLDHVRVTDNEAFASGGPQALASGGGIRAFNGLTMNASTIDGNRAIASDGADQTEAKQGGIGAFGEVSIVGSTISGNLVEASSTGTLVVAQQAGAALFGTPTAVKLSTVSGNAAVAKNGSSVTEAKAGALELGAEGLVLTGLTITGNSVSSTGVAKSANVAATQPNTVRDTIVAAPVGASSCGTPLTSGGFNIDDGTSCGFTQSSDLSGVDPGLDPALRDNGGPTFTHALLSTSVAIDHGKAFGAITDQRELPRLRDSGAAANALGGDGSDTGAFELQDVPAATAVQVQLVPGDTQAPNTRILRGPARLSFKRLAKFRFASTEAQSSFRCKLDKKAWRGCANPFKRSVKPGRHLFKVRAIDRFGNVDPTPARFGWRVKPLS